MPEALSKVLILAGSAALACFVIGILVYAGSQGAALSSSMVSGFSSVDNRLSNADINQYNNNVVTGADVLNTIKRFQDRVTITVTTLSETGATTETIYSGTKRINNTPVSSDGSTNTKYINPYACFNSSVSINANGVAAGLNFVQQSYVALADTGKLTGDGTGAGAGAGSGSGYNPASGSSVGADYAALKDLIDTQNEQITSLTEAINSQNTANGSQISTINEKLESLSSEHQWLKDAFAKLEDAVNKLQFQIEIPADEKQE